MTEDNRKELVTLRETVNTLNLQLQKEQIRRQVCVALCSTTHPIILLLIGNATATSIF